MPPSGPEERRRLGRLLAVLCFVAVIGPMATFLYLPALPEVARLFGTTEAGAQATLTAFLAGNCLGFAVLGAANDRFGQRRIFVAAMLLFTGASLLAAVSQNLAWLIAARFVQGIGASVGVITARSTVRQTFPDGGSQGMAILSAMGGMAPAASPLIGAVVLLFADWRMTFIASAGLGILALVLALPTLPAAGAIVRQGADGGTMRIVLVHPETRAGLLMGSLHNGTFMVMMAGSPFIFVDSFDWSPVAYSLLFGGILSIFAVLSVLSGRAFPHHGLRRVMAWGLPGMTIGAVLQLIGALNETDWAVALGLMMMIGSMGPIVPGNHMRMLNPFPERAGSVVGISMLTVTGSGVLLIWLYGTLSSGSVTAYGIWIGVLALAAVAAWIIYPPPKAASQGV